MKKDITNMLMPNVKEVMDRGNTPYERIMDGDKLLNPIEKGKPYLSVGLNRRTRRAGVSNTLKNNKRGIRLIITNIGKGRFTKTKIVRQVIGDKQIFHNVLVN